MTAQFADEVGYRDVYFYLTAVDGNSLFDPAAHGINPGPWGTALRRGFQCRYLVADQSLFLSRLAVASEHEPHALNDRRPVHDAGVLDGAWVYEGLGLAVKFSGRLLLGDAIIPNRPYINMGFLPAWCFETVWELAFSDGRLSEARDRSEALAAVRERMLANYPLRRDGDALKKWVADTFSLSFAYSWPQDQ